MANSPLVGKTTPSGEPLLKSMPAKTENGWSENGKKKRKEEGEKSPGIHASHVPSYLSSQELSGGGPMIIPILVRLNGLSQLTWLLREWVMKTKRKEFQEKAISSQRP